MPCPNFLTSVLLSIAFRVLYPLGALSQIYKQIIKSVVPKKKMCSKWEFYSLFLYPINASPLKRSAKREMIPKCPHTSVNPAPFR